MGLRSGAISHGVTASNLVVGRILTDTLISRSPHCVLGARYDGNVNLFYVGNDGIWQTEGLDGFSRYKLYQQQSICGEQRKRIWHAQSGNVQCLQNPRCSYWHRSIAVRPHDQVFPEDESAVGKFDSIRPVPPFSYEQVALSDRFRPTVPPIRSLLATPQDRFWRCATHRYIATHLGYTRSRWHARQWREGSNASWS